MKTQRKMFPDQNIHYAKNYSIGYQGVNFVKSTEYNGKYNYDAGKAIQAIEGSSPRYKRRKDSLTSNNASLPIHQKMEGSPAYPTIDSRPPPTYEAPDEYMPSSGADHGVGRDPDSLLINVNARRDEESLRGPYMPPEEPMRMEVPPSLPPQDFSAAEQVREYVPEVRRPEPVPPPMSKLEASLSPQKKPNSHAYREELDRQLQQKQQLKRDAADMVRAQDIQMVRGWQQEQDQFKKSKAEESRAMQEITKKYYEKQIQEREDRATGSRSKEPPAPSNPSPVRTYDMPPDRPAVIESRRKIMNEMEKLEKEKERVKMELAVKDSVLSKAAVDPSGFLQDINRERFQQVNL